MPICDDEARKLDYLAGALGDAEREAFAAHLAVCPACREEVAALRAVMTGLGGLPRSAPPAALVAATKARLRRRAAPAPRGAWLGPVLAAAVMIALGFLLLGGAGEDLSPLAGRLAAALTPPDLPGEQAATAALSAEALLAGLAMVLAFLFLLRLLDDLGFLVLRRRLRR